MDKMTRRIRKMVWKNVGIQLSDLILLAVFSVFITVIVLTVVNMVEHEYVDWKVIAAGW